MTHNNILPKFFNTLTHLLAVKKRRQRPDKDHAKARHLVSSTWASRRSKNSRDLSPTAQAIVDDPSSVPADVLIAGVAEGERHIVGLNQADNVSKNGWSTGRSATGFGTDIVRRPAGTKFGLGGHQAIENRSYVAQHDSEQEKLDGTRPLQLRFAANDMPPCHHATMPPCHHAAHSGR